MSDSFINLIGKRFGRLAIVSRAEPSGTQGARWKCLCDCGAQVVVASISLRHGTTKSCGCFRRDMQDAMRRARRGSGWAEGGKKTPTYRVWQNMKTRCLNPRNVNYANYGGRGIHVCERWAASFDAFLNDMGEKPDGRTLDRFPDMNGNYEVGNCRWATPTEQARNTRHVKLTESVRAVVDMRLAAGEIQRVVGDAVGADQTTISDYVRRKTWREDGEVQRPRVRLNRSERA